MQLFVDTSAFIAGASRKGRRHRDVRAILEGLPPNGRLFTSDYVFDETITRARRMEGHKAAADLGERLRSSAVVRITNVESRDQEEAWALFLRYSDKELSFTDCTTAALMRRLALRSILTLDHEFRQLGFDVLPKP